MDNRLDSPPERGEAQDKTHPGSAGSYRKGCRCSACRAAWSAYSLEARARRKQRLGTKPVEHGSRWTFYNHGCSCALCSAAMLAYYRQRHWARKFAAGVPIHVQKRYRIEYQDWLDEQDPNPTILRGEQ